MMKENEQDQLEDVPLLEEDKENEYLEYRQSISLSLSLAKTAYIKKRSRLKLFRLMRDYLYFEFAAPKDILDDFTSYLDEVIQSETNKRVSDKMEHQITLKEYLIIKRSPNEAHEIKEYANKNLITLDTAYKRIQTFKRKNPWFSRSK